jgi:hypothetical protein
MATPFGVYLTTGNISGGKKGWHLFSTGMFLMVFFFAGNKALELVTRGLPDTWIINLLVYGCSALIMLGTFRLLPIAGYHAAEHQVVHAFERDEELVPEVIARMPRVHPRCGTNLATAATLFWLIAFTPWPAPQDFRIFVGLMVTVYLWRPLGSFVQYWFTTKKPNERQIASGIAAGKELLANYAIAPNRIASPFARILHSGMLHVIAGSFAASGIAWLVERVFGIAILPS